MKRRQLRKKGAAYSVDAVLAIFLTLLAILSINGYISRVGYNKLILAQPSDVVSDMMTVAHHNGLLRDFYLENEPFFEHIVMDSSRSQIGPEGVSNGVYRGAELRNHPHDYYDRWVDFNGVDAFIEIPNSSRFDFNGESPFTISFWMLARDTSARQSLISRGNASEGYGIYLENGNLIFATRSSSEYASASFSAGLQEDIWHHVVVVFIDSADVNVYVNNVSLSSTGSINHTTPFTSSNFNLTFGKSADPAQEYFFNGSLDDIRIFNREISHTGSGGSVEQLYRNESIISGLMAKYDFNTYTFATNQIQSAIPSQYRIALVLEDVDGMKVGSRAIPEVTSLRKFITSGDRIIAVEKNDDIIDFVRVRYYAWTQ